MVWRARDVDCRVVQPPVRTSSDVSAPCEYRVRVARGEGDRDARRAVARVAPGERVARDGSDRPSIEREVPRDLVGRVRIRRDWECRAGATAGNAETWVGIGDRAVPGREVVDRVLATLGRVPFDGDRVRAEAQVVEPEPVRDRIALEVARLARAQDRK